MSLRMSGTKSWELKVNRREFVNSCTVAGLGAAVGRPSAFSGGERIFDPPSPAPPFSLSVMLWTVESKLPFEQRIAKVAEAGYHAVELVGEWQDGWSIPGLEQFVVITPDSCTITRVKIDLQQLQRNGALTVQEVRSMNERTHALIREFAEHAHGQKKQNSPLSVFSGSDYFSIKVEDNALERPPEAMPFEVIARAPRAVQFQYELHQMPDVPKIFDEDSENADHFFQNTPPPANWKQNTARNRNIDLDSVISAPRDRKARPQTDQNKKRYKNPFEL